MLDKPNVEFVKLDLVTFDSKTHHFTEVSCIYNLSNKKQSKLDIKRSIASEQRVICLNTCKAVREAIQPILQGSIKKKKKKKKKKRVII